MYFHLFKASIYGKFWRIRSVWHTVLMPLSWLYYLAYLIRYHILSFPKKIEKPVICVGNITVGGAGKTEVALALGRLCLKLRLRPVFIAHGYNSAIRGDKEFIVVNSKLHTSADVGDEAILLAQLAPTYISKDRVVAARAAAKEADILIFDDGMQNNKLKKDLVFSVINSDYLFGNQLLLPVGPLREPIVGSIARSDYFVFTYCDGVLDQSRKELQALFTSNKPIMYLNTEILNAEQIKGRSFVAICGIANPANFLRTLHSLNITVVEYFIFSDHHQYTEQDLESVCLVATKCDVKIITTAKDVARIPQKYHAFIEVVRLYSNFHATKELSNTIIALTNRF